jgi:hypothetical protein
MILPRMLIMPRMLIPLRFLTLPRMLIMPRMLIPLRFLILQVPARLGAKIQPMMRTHQPVKLKMIFSG